MADNEEPFKPVVERVKGTVFPYRGMETHGVEPDANPHDPPGYEQEPAIVYEEVPPEMEPVPVRIVSSPHRGVEFKMWRTYDARVQGTNGQPITRQIAGRNANRTRLRIQNVDGFWGVAISNKDGFLPVMGFTVMPNTYVELITQDEVFGVVAAGGDQSTNPVVRVVVLEEYSVEVNE